MGHQRPTCFCLFVCADNDDQITVAMCECATSETLLLLQQEMQIEQEVCDPWFSSSANKTTGPRGYKHTSIRIYKKTLNSPDLMDRCSPRDTNTHRAKNTVFKNLEHNVTLLFESFPPPING